jgi:pimeloyl-ACP methyl ester carboxylesterase
MITQTRARFGTVETRVLSVDGEGTPIVLLHGYADTADTWLGVLNRLGRAGRRAMAVDLPGFGSASARDDGPMLPQFDAFADVLLTETGPAVLVGNSLGAATSVRAASRNPAVAALVALDDPLAAHHLLARLVRRRDLAPAFWSRLGRAPVPARAVQWATRRATPGVLYGPGARPDPDVLAQWSRTVGSLPAVAALGRYAFQYARETRSGHLGVRVDCPTLVVHGARDRIIPVHSSRTLHRLIPGSDFVVLPKSGHCPQLDNADEVVRLTLALLERNAL